MKPTYSNNKLLIIALAAIIIFTFLRLYEKNAFISTEHLDGAYQTFNALNRISTGDILGKDFYPYLGLGPTYSVYPLFKLLGGSIFSSQLSSSIVILIFWIFSLYTLTKFSPIKKVSQKSQIILLMLIYAYYATRIAPGNSLLGARSFAVILSAWSVYYFLIKDNRPILFGLSLSILFLWSNDYGIPTALSMLIVSVIHNKTIFNRNTAINLVMLIITVPIILILVTNNNIISYLNFTTDIAKDQFWYFYPYIESEKYYSFTDIILFWNHGWQYNTFILLFSIPLLLTLFFSAIKHNDTNSKILLTISLSAFGAGLLSEIAGHKSLRYFSMYLSSLPFIAIHLTYTYKNQLSKNIQIKNTLNLLMSQCKSCKNTVLYILIFISALGIIYETKKIYRTKNHSTYVYQTDGYIKNEDIEIINTSIKLKSFNENTLILSEYSGLPNIIFNQKNVLNSDSIIHALGEKTRKTFITKILSTKYQFATTTNPIHSDWQNWSFFQNWHFYKHIINNFVPKKATTKLIFWENENPRKSPIKKSIAPECEVIKLSRNKTLLKIHSLIKTMPTIFELKITYSHRLRRSIIPIVGKNKLIHVKGLMKNNTQTKLFTISPYKTNAEFPVIFNGNPNNIILTASPIDRSQLKINSCKVEFITNNELKIKSVLKSY